jgi:hypothetical protein
MKWPEAKSEVKESWEYRKGKNQRAVRQQGKVTEVTPFPVYLCAHNVIVPNLLTRCAQFVEVIGEEKYLRSKRPRCRKSKDHVLPSL